MKVLVVKTNSILPSDVRFDVQKAIEKQVSSGVLLLDGGYTYEVVDIDVVKMEEVKKPCGSYYFDNKSITFPSMIEADRTRRTLIEICNCHGYISIADYKEVCDKDKDVRYTDHMYGWKHLTMHMMPLCRTRGDFGACRWYISLPAPEHIE